jgi:hypothetical protein
MTIAPPLPIPDEPQADGSCCAVATDRAGGTAAAWHRVSGRHGRPATPQRRWVRHHARIEGRPNPKDVTADRDARAGPGFSVRVQPRAGTGTTEIHKEGD